MTPPLRGVGDAAPYRLPPKIFAQTKSDHLFFRWPLLVCLLQAFDHICHDLRRGPDVLGDAELLDNEHLIAALVGDAETKKAIEEKCRPDCVEMEGAAVSQIAGRNGVPCVILRAMSDNADESGYEVLVVKQFSITEYVKTATEIVANMIESL